MSEEIGTRAALIESIAPWLVGVGAISLQPRKGSNLGPFEDQFRFRDRAPGRGTHGDGSLDRAPRLRRRD